MIINAALTHRVERFDNRVAVRRLAAPLPSAPQQLEDAALGEFRRGADTAMELVDLTQQPLGDPVELLRGDRIAALRSAEALQCLAQHPDVLGDLVAVAGISVA